MLPCVPHLINIAQLGGLAKEEERGIWRAGEAVFAQESEILSEVPAERGLCQADSGAREGPRRLHSSTGSRDHGALLRNKNISGHRGGRLSGRSEGQCPFCELSRVGPPCCPPGGHGTRQPAAPASAGARSMSQAQRQAPQSRPPGSAAHSLSLPVSPCPFSVEYALAQSFKKLVVFFFFKFVWLI